MTINLTSSSIEHMTSNTQPIEQRILEVVGDRLTKPSSVGDIAGDGGYFVYILTVDQSAVVVGHGKQNRARVIFDAHGGQQTSGHIKAMLVRLHSKYNAGSQVQRFLIRCTDKAEARALEMRLHHAVGGNTLSPSMDIQDQVFEGISKGSLLHFMLKAAMLSAFDGLYDLAKWRRAGLVSDEDWAKIVDKLALKADLPVIVDGVEQA